MMGRSHAVSAAAVWVWASPPLLGIDSPVTLVGSAMLAAGAGVLPDVDHPDAQPARQFGLLSRIVGRATASAAGGHRQGTHTAVFAALLSGVLWALQYWQAVPADAGRASASVFAAFLAAVGFSLLAPSFGLRASPLVAVAVAAVAGWWIWHVSPSVWLPPLVALGVMVHIVGDWFTPSGVPFLAPFSSRRWSARLFRTGSGGEHLVAAACWVAVAAGLWVNGFGGYAEAAFGGVSTAAEAAAETMGFTDGT